MKDKELRGIVLKYFYDGRRGPYLEPKPTDFSPEVEAEDLYSICDQLGEHGYINWKPVNVRGFTVTGMGKITSIGVDVIESEGEASEISITVPEIIQNINISNSSVGQVGNQNSMNITISDILNEIERADVSEEEKKDAKALLANLLKHPLVASCAGASLSGLLKLL